MLSSWGVFTSFNIILDIWGILWQDLHVISTCGTRKQIIEEVNANESSSELDSGT